MLSSIRAMLLQVSVKKTLSTAPWTSSSLEQRQLQPPCAGVCSTWLCTLKSKVSTWVDAPRLGHNGASSRIYKWGKEGLFNKCFWENWTATCKRMTLQPFLTSYTKINSKCIKDLNVRPETIKLLEENTGRTLYDTNHSKVLYDPPPKVMAIKTKIKKWGPN